jgi:alpha-mannosidase
MGRINTVVTVVLVLFSTCGCNAVHSQGQAYFIDGYHGGVYGHYPMWVTQFMVDNLARYPEWRIGLEIEPETWDTVKVKERTAYDHFRNIAADSRVEFTNPTYSQPYCYNISGESVIRQFAYGIKKIHEHFPDAGIVTYSVEEPCFTSCLPQILKLFGFKYAVLKCPNTCWGGYTAAYGKDLVNWTGSDGTSLPAVPRYACEKLEDGSTWQTKAWNNSDSYLQDCFEAGIRHPAGMCYQDAGWKNGPWIGYGEKVKNKSVYVTWKEYFETVSAGRTDDDYYFSQEDVSVNLMWGSQVLQKIAQEVRVSENKTVTAEKMSAMANIDNGYSPSEEKMDDAWRTLMLAQHHDSWIVPYNRLNGKGTWAQEITLWTENTNGISDDLIEGAMATYHAEARPTVKDSGYIRVYNTLGISRSEWVKVKLPLSVAGDEAAVYDSRQRLLPSCCERSGDSVRVSFQAEVPALGYATFRVKEGTSVVKKHIPIRFASNGDCVLENDMYRITVDSRGGIIGSLVAKKEGNKEYADKDSRFGLGELRGHFYEEGGFRSSTESRVKISILEDSYAVKKIKAEGTIASHPFIQTITLTAGQKRIDFDLTVNWRNNTGIGEYRQAGNVRDNRRAFTDDRYKLNVMFPVNLSPAKLYKNAPFDVCESKHDNTFFGTWDSIKHNVILNWADVAETGGKYGFALFSDHTTSYSYGEDFPLSLTAQYSGIGLWGPDYKITRPMKMRYAIVPHAGKWDEAAIWTESNKWNEPLRVSVHEGMPSVDRSFVHIDRAGYEISTFKVEAGNILVRFFNAEGDGSKRKITFGFPVASAEEVDLNGNVLSEKVVDERSVWVSMPRFGIKTLLLRKN